MPFNLGVDELGVKAVKYIEKFKKELLGSMGENVRSIIVFGSRVEDRWKPWSDIDVLIVLKEAPKGIERFKSIPYVPSIQPWIYTEKELLKAIREFDIAVLDALEIGIVIYDDGFWINAKRIFDKFKEEWELVKVNDGWISKKIQRERLRQRMFKSLSENSLNNST